jgi:hypothetical protein
MSFVASRRVVVAAAGALALIAIVVAVKPEGASGGLIGPQPPCERGMLCAYADDDFDGQVVRIRKRGVSNAIFAQLPLQVSSVRNRRTTVSYLYEFTDGKGYRICLEPGERIAALGPIGFDDDATSSRNTKRATVCPKTLNRECNKGEFCVWQHYPPEGRLVEIAKPGASDLLNRWMPDEASTTRNRRDAVSFLLESPPGEPGAKLCAEPGSPVQYVGDIFNDLASGTQLTRSRNSCQT